MLDYVDHPPPNASLITIGATGPDGVTLVTGDPGSVPPLVHVIVATVEYGDAVAVRSAMPLYSASWRAKIRGILGGKLITSLTFSLNT